MRRKNFSLLSMMFGVGGFSTYFLIILFICGIVGMFTWPYGINAWLVYAGKPPTIMWWQGFLIGCIPFFGAWSVVFAVITWILLMFL